MRNTKGKTYEEIYGVKKAKQLRKLRKNNAISQMKKQRKGKTHSEIYGKEKAILLSKDKSIRYSGEGNPNYKGNNLFINCQECNKEFEIKKCKEFTKKYCSMGCYTKSQSNKIERICQVCLNIYSTKPSINLLYCSRKCFKVDMKLEGNPNWKNGISFEPYNPNWTKELRLEIRKRDNFICKLCNLSEQESITKYGRVLSVHHIDYNKDNCTENNLITACVKCNSKVNKNRSYWTKYFKNILEEALV